MAKFSLNNSRKLLTLLTRRFVSTSRKNNDTVTVEMAINEAKSKTVNKNWVSYGYDLNSKKIDRNAMHSIMFTSVTLCLVVGGFYFAYMPDFTLRDWAQREAFLELRRREEKGLLPIDANYVNPAKISLPSDEELGSTPIIV